MRYRIKDPKQRNAAVEIFGDIANELPPGDSASLSLDVPGSIMHPVTAEFELEPVPDNAPWHEYKGERLDPDTEYLVIRKNKCGRYMFGISFCFSDGHFSESENVMAWMKIPEWKE